MKLPGETNLTPTECLIIDFRSGGMKKVEHNFVDDTGNDRFSGHRCSGNDGFSGQIVKEQPF